MISGEIFISGDKSISHRILMLGSVISNKVVISNLSSCDDINTTISCLEDCGSIFTTVNSYLIISSSSLSSPTKKLNCMNSGTTARLLIGLLAGQCTDAAFIGDKSLSKRPMERIINPFKLMGLNISSSNNFLPIIIKKSLLKSIDYKLNIPSAQVKSSILLSNFNNKVTDPFGTRDHTERMIKYIRQCNSKSDIYFKVPGDISSAGFLIVLCIITYNSSIIIKDVLYNKTRNGLIDILKQMGSNIKIKNIRSNSGEYVCDIYAQYTSDLNAVDLDCKIYNNMIDEIPIFCAAALFCKGITTISNAGELKYKESNRLNSIYANFIKMNVGISEIEDGLVIAGNKLYNTCKINSSDHRIIMMLEVLNVAKAGKGILTYNNAVNISFPEFYTILDRSIK